MLTYMQQRRTIQPIQNTSNESHPPKVYVDANVIGGTYSMTGRYVLKLAAEGKIPCLRIGKKCVRFDLAAVAAALENNG